MQSGDTFFTRPIAAEAERRPAAIRRQAACSRVASSRRAVAGNG